MSLGLALIAGSSWWASFGCDYIAWCLRTRGGARRTSARAHPLSCAGVCSGLVYFAMRPPIGADGDRPSATASSVGCPGAGFRSEIATSDCPDGYRYSGSPRGLRSWAPIVRPVVSVDLGGRAVSRPQIALRSLRGSRGHSNEHVMVPARPCTVVSPREKLQKKHTRRLERACSAGRALRRH